MKSAAMREVEKRFGRPLEELLPELYAHHSSESDVAVELGISRNTLFVWRMRLGLQTKTVKEVIAHSQPDDKAS